MKTAHKINTLAPERNPEFEKLCNLLRGRDIQMVALKAGLTPATLYKWLDGSTQSPRIENVAKVARVIGYRLKLVKGVK